MPQPFAIISDIHSNLEALEAVLADIRKLGNARVVCLGDVVGYASSVRQCVRAVQELNCPVLLGNHDEAACGGGSLDNFNDAAAEGIRFAASRLTKAQREWLAGVPRTVEIDGLLFTHASLEEEDWPYITTAAEAEDHFDVQWRMLCFCGHTHRPALWHQESEGDYAHGCNLHGTTLLPEYGKLLINVGSVGQPRDLDPRACYVIYRPGDNTVELRRVEYDIQKTQRKIRRAGLPRFNAQRLGLGR